MQKTKKLEKLGFVRASSGRYLKAMLIGLTKEKKIKKEKVLKKKVRFILVL